MNAFASIPVLTLAALLASGSHAQSDTAVYMRLFDGKTLDGWRGRAGTWTVKAGAIACSDGGANDWRTVEIIVNVPKVVHMINVKKCWEKADFKVLK